MLYIINLIVLFLWCFSWKEIFFVLLQSFYQHTFFTLGRSKTWQFRSNSNVPSWGCKEFFYYFDVWKLFCTIFCLKSWLIFEFFIKLQFKKNMNNTNWKWILVRINIVDKKYVYIMKKLILKRFDEYFSLFCCFVNSFNWLQIKWNIQILTTCWLFLFQKM